MDLLAVSLLLLSSSRIVSSEMTIIDLSHNFDESTIYWPTTQADKFNLTQMDIVDDGTFYYEMNKFSAAEHGGTHIDAPRHFAKGKQGVHEIPLTNLVGKAYIADFTVESSKNADFQIEEKHLKAYEEKHGKIQDGSILLLYTGWLEVTLFIKY